MSFATFCLCHALDAQVRWAALVQALQRIRLRREREARLARLWTDVEAGL